MRHEEIERREKGLCVMHYYYLPQPTGFSGKLKGHMAYSSLLK